MSLPVERSLEQLLRQIMGESEEFTSNFKLTVIGEFDEAIECSIQPINNEDPDNLVDFDVKGTSIKVYGIGGRPNDRGSR